jgi:hypothetical protein
MFPVATLEGAKANVQALGLPEHYVAGKILSADSNYHSEEKLQACAQEPVDASIPDAHFRGREPRVATQERHTPQPEARFTLSDVTYDQQHES